MFTIHHYVDGFVFNLNTTGYFCLVTVTTYTDVGDVISEMIKHDCFLTQKFGKKSKTGI